MGLVQRIKATLLRQLTIREADGVSPEYRSSDAGEMVSNGTALSLSSVWACVNLVAGTIGTLPLSVYQIEKGNRVVARGHPLYRLLHDSPNFDQTAVDFWEFVAASLELWGNAFAAVERSESGAIAALIPIRPDLMTVRRRADMVIEYEWSDEGRYQKRDETQIFHVRGFGGSALGGMSTLHFGRQAFGLARAVDRAAASTFRNGLRPSGSLSVPTWLSAEQRQLANSNLVEKFAGAMNTGRPMILEGGVTWTALAINPEDAQMLESRRFSVEEICRFFGVPPHMVGHTEKGSSWGTGLEQQALGFQKFTLRRRLKRIEQAVNKQLLTPAERSAGIFVEFNLEGLLRGDSASRATFYQSGLTNGWMTINEVRALENLVPVPGGDVPRMQMQNVPITEALNGPNG